MCRFDDRPADCFSAAICAAGMRALDGVQAVHRLHVLVHRLTSMFCLSNNFELIKHLTPVADYGVWQAGGAAQAGCVSAC
jgi:hypothetical protein